MKSKVISVLLAMVMLTVAAGVFAKGQPKVGVCHLDDEGKYNLINIAEPAVESHFAHGDSFPSTSGLDENCEPFSQLTLEKTIDGISISPGNGDNTPEQGEVVQYIMTVTNMGTSSSEAAVLVDNPPVGTFVLNGLPEPPASCFISLPQPAGYVCNIPSLQPNQSVELHIGVYLDTVTDGGSVTNTAVLTGPDYETESSATFTVGEALP